MKNKFQKLALLTIPFLLVGCAQPQTPSQSSSGEGSGSSGNSSTEPASSSNPLDNYTPVIPELRFTSNVASQIDFATTATKSDPNRPEVSGKITLTNCADQYKKTDFAATMKVRGNQTAGWRKKAFRIKFDAKTNLMGLNGGKKFKKWVLLADAKDTALIRSAIGFGISKAVCKDDDQVWVSDFTPVSVYLNDQYWGFYYLAEQKEVNDGRVRLAEPEEDYQGVDIGYCFELDHYAEDEPKKTDGGDPTFSVTYSPSFTRSNYNIESTLANFGETSTYTMLSDITDSTAGQNKPVNATNSAQVAFIKKRVESLFTVLSNATKGIAKTINENNQVVDSSDTVEKVIRDNFDLNAWADGFIINAFACPPDLGYSSFYMSFDNTPTGDKKLRYDVPWDFDSNFGNRRDFITTADSKTGNFDPYYMDRTSNMWLQLLGKLSFFMDIVKTKWNKIREEQAFENMFHMVRTYFRDYDIEIQKDHQRWPENDAASMVYNNFDEIREPYKDPANYKQAEEETINWCAKRVNYLEKKWGNNRPSVNTNA